MQVVLKYSSGKIVRRHNFPPFYASAKFWLMLISPPFHLKSWAIAIEVRRRR